jgi:hypothetical protein
MKMESMRKQTTNWSKRGAILTLSALILCASGLLWGESPGGEASGLDAHLDKEPVRKEKGLELRKTGWTYDCMECHASLKANWHLGDQLMEHRDLELKHGNNRFCLNCHHPENRNVFVDYDGSEIAEEDVVLLCAKCHGPQHRDWMKGAHGRRNGYWDVSKGESAKLACIQCHDPHDPSFKAMEPLPGPSYPARAAGNPDKKSHHEEENSHHGD